MFESSTLVQQISLAKMYFCAGLLVLRHLHLQIACLTKSWNHSTTAKRTPSGVYEVSAAGELSVRNVKHQARGQD